MAKKIRTPEKPKKLLALPVSTLSMNNGATPIIDPPLLHKEREVINPNRQHRLLKTTKKAKKS